jgi:pimeloyl-ACP methyl ester carboxylesterase
MTAVDGIEIQALLAIGGLVPGEQQSFISALPRRQRWTANLAIRVAGTTPPAAVIRQGLCSRLDDGTTKRIIDDFRGSPRSHFLDPVGPRRLPARRGYVVTTEDRELSTDLQRDAASALRTTWCKDLPTGHLPMLEAPDALAEAVDAFLMGADEPATLT